MAFRLQATPLFTKSTTHSPYHSHSHSLTHSLIHSLTPSLTHSLTRSLTHPPTLESEMLIFLWTKLTEAREDEVAVAFRSCEHGMITIKRIKSTKRETITIARIKRMRRRITMKMTKGKSETG